jgi:hypothetical protein
MGWTVKNEDGSLEFPTLADVERAYRMGLVEPSDQLREHGKNHWSPAGEHPALRHSAPRKKSALPARVWLGSGLAVALAVVALVLIARGSWALGLAIAAGVTLFLFRFNRRVAFGVQPRRRQLLRP